jgi:DNA-binding winged helix-turn-helix (wHTH) protein
VLNLLTHGERAVGKEEWLRAVRPGLLLEENNLQVQISTIRKILGTGTISTITERGYPFTAAADNDLATLPQEQWDAAVQPTAVTLGTSSKGETL